MSHARVPASALVESPFRTARQREEERAAKRQALLVAAVRMFNERGFHASSLDDVAGTLGVTKPVIYHHLGNKDQVLFECVRIGLAQLQEASRESGAGGTGLDRLRLFLVRYGEIIMGDFGRCVIRTGDETLSVESRAQFRRLKREIDQALRILLAEAVADGSAVVPDVRLTTFAFTGALNGCARWYREDGGMSAETIASGMVEILCAGIMPRGVGDGAKSGSPVRTCSSSFGDGGLGAAMLAYAGSFQLRMTFNCGQL